MKTFMTFMLKYGFFGLMMLAEYQLSIFSETMAFFDRGFAALFTTMPDMLAPTGGIATLFAFVLPAFMFVSSLGVAIWLATKRWHLIQYSLSVFIFGGLAGIFLPTFLNVTESFITSAENTFAMWQTIGSIALLAWLMGWSAFCGGLYKQTNPEQIMFSSTDFDFADFFHVFVPWTYFMTDELRASEVFQSWLQRYETNQTTQKML